MNDDLIKEKNKINEIQIEIDNLRKYSNELANNVRGEKLENYISNMIKNINLLQNEIEKTYEENYQKIETE